MEEKNKLIYDNQCVLFGSKKVVGYGNESFYVKEVDRSIANEIIKKNHYSHKIYNATYIHLGVFINGELLGILQYGYAMNPASMDGVVEGTKLDEYLELNRMWLDDKAGRNSESKAISYSIKYIRNVYPKIKWIQSFADERCGCYGIVYQACSFDYYGEHTTEFYELDDVWYHRTNATINKNSKRYKNNVGNCKYLIANLDRAKKVSLRQFRYIKFLKQSWKSKCRLKQMPYPKYYNDNNKSNN